MSDDTNFVFAIPRTIKCCHCGSIVGNKNQHVYDEEENIHYHMNCFSKRYPTYPPHKAVKLVLLFGKVK